MNLLSNALKFSPMNAKITVTLVQIFTGKSLEGCEIHVRDEGIGIKPEEQALIFRPFFQTSDSRSRDLNTNSHGIGLNLSQKLARVLQGSIRVESKPGKGSTFILALS